MYYIYKIEWHNNNFQTVVFYCKDLNPAPILKLNWPDAKWYQCIGKVSQIYWKEKAMKSEDINTVGDLINFLLQFDPQKRVMIYDYEYGQDNPLQHIDVEDDKIVMYD